MRSYRVRAEVDPDANVIFGSTFDQAMEGKIRVSVVATGMDAPAQVQRPPLLEVIRGGAVADKPPALPESETPPLVSEPAPAAMAAASIQAGPVELPPVPTHRPPSIDAGVYIPAAAATAAPEPKRSFSLFERLTGASRRNPEDR